LFGGFQDDRESGLDIGEFFFGEAVRTRDDAVEFGAERRTFTFYRENGRIG
jgi:hypothetical protein